MPSRVVPIELRKLRGNPSKRPLPNVPQPSRLSESPEPPARLGPTARAEWCRLAPELARMGLLTALDLATFEVMVVTRAHWLDTEAVLRDDTALVTGPLGKVAREYARDGIRYMAEFGLTPCARMKLRAEPPEDHGKFTGLLGGYD
jgi:P27 family predicted phage terminase small subunit